MYCVVFGVQFSKYAALQFMVCNSPYTMQCTVWYAIIPIPCSAVYSLQLVLYNAV